MKERYEAPQVQVIEMEMRGRIAIDIDGLVLSGYTEGTLPEFISVEPF